MTFLVSILGIAGRYAGDLLTATTGWAGSLMFGRVPQSHQRYLSAMLGGSILWAILVLAFFLPALVAWSLTTTPHPGFITASWLAFVVTVGIIILPTGVGAAAYLAPAEGRRARGIRAGLEIARGYVLTPVIVVLVVFLAGVGLSRKARSARHHWIDTHIPVVVPSKGYDETVDTLQGALADAGILLQAVPAPRVLSAPAWILSRLSGPGIASLRSERLIELCNADVRVGIYPSDVAVSTQSRLRTPIRATILASLINTDAHLTMSAEAQKIEDELKKARAEDRLTKQRAAISSINATLLQAEISTDEWDLLYRLRLQVERDMLGRELNRADDLDGVTFAADAEATAASSAEWAATAPLTQVPVL